MSTAAETTAPTTEPATPTPPGPPRRRSRRTREAPGARGSTPLRMIAGAMTRLVRDDFALLVGLAFADVTEGDYLQLYLAPSFARGNVPT